MRVSITFWGWNEGVIEVLNSKGEVVKRLIVEPVTLYNVFALLSDYTYDLFIDGDSLAFARLGNTDMCSSFVTSYRDVYYGSRYVGTIGELISADGSKCGYIAPEFDAMVVGLFDRYTVYVIKPSTPRDSGRLVVGNRSPKLAASFECGVQTPAVCLSQVSIRRTDDATVIIDIPYDAYYMDTYSFSKIRISCALDNETATLYLYRTFSGGRYLVKCYDHGIA